jgi:cytochrome subunit of sulfide dehydrogenase
MLRLLRLPFGPLVAIVAIILGMAVFVLTQEGQRPGPPWIAASISDDAAVLGRSLAATCTGCHGAAAGIEGSRPTSLAGMPADFIIDRTRAFRDERHQGTLMHRLAMGYTDEEVALLAAYFAAQDR